jgi:hypothetical protein
MVEYHELDPADIHQLLARYGLELISVNPGAAIPASYWGAPEAGLAGRCLFVRDDTPAHSLLHEMSHYICMTPDRRNELWRDAGGDVDEESAVCYLQVLLAENVPALGRDRILNDLDSWGYSFREGSAGDWFHGDGRLSREWLRSKDLIDDHCGPTWRLRS